MTAATAEPLNDDFLALADKLADAAGAVSMRYFRTPIDIDAKPDASPVTIADKEAEDAMRALIEAAYPDHGIIGEERDNKNESAQYVWVLDPIDGTQSFVTGKPVFGTLIGLLKDGKPILGVMDMPALKERWAGAVGQATTFNGEAVKVRACGTVAKAWLYATSPQMFGDADFPAFEKLRKASWRAVYGAECMAYGLLANGLVDIVCEGTMDLHDYAPMVPIIEGAGGVITDWQGRALGIDGDGTVLAAGDAAVHAEGLALLAR
ncbi:MAG: histidinol-phosphatase [Proteobacteria bacterium]|nr:histidinol-phosphatase [Pseudomonadota bacterium]MDA1022070.1 histidinol-phosphatase [Pseudomonadota bacterium]